MTRPTILTCDREVAARIFGFESWRKAQEAGQSAQDQVAYAATELALHREAAEARGEARGQETANKEIVERLTSSAAKAIRMSEEFAASEGSALDLSSFAADQTSFANVVLAIADVIASPVHPVTDD